jgi:hypothetical protein
MSIEAMKQALEALSCSDDFLFDYHDCEPNNEQEQQRYDVARIGNRRAIESLRQTIGQAEKQEPVAELTDDEIHDAAYATFCRGPNTRELFRMMWTCNPPCSIGWDRNELKAFARHIASLYTAPPPRQPLTDEEIDELCWTEMDRRLLSFARAIEAAHGIKGEA